MNVLQYIKQNFEGFTDREKLIVEYLFSNKRNIIGMSAKEIGDITNTSTPTVVRFSKKTDFDSLNEMKLQLSLNLKSDEDNPDFEYLHGDLSTKNITHGIKRPTDSIMDQTISISKEDQLEKAIDLLNEAKNIYILSVGVSSLVGMDFYYKLSRINKRCIAHSDTHLQITSSVLMEKGDIVIAISYSGKTKEVIKCTENAKKTKVPVIAITKASISNTLADIPDTVLRVPFVEKTLREGAMSPRISQLSIIDMLFIGMAETNLESVEEKFRVTRKAVEELKN